MNFDEPFDPASVGIDDLVLSQGTVMAAQVLDIDSVVYTLTDIVAEGTLAVEIPAGSISDEFGNPIEAQALSYDVDWTTDYPFPTPLAPISPAGSLIHESSHAAFVSFDGDSDSYTIHVDPNQTMTVIVDPESNLRAQITLSDGEQNWIAQSDTAGEDAVLQTIATGHHHNVHGDREWLGQLGGVLLPGRGSQCCC